MTQPTPRFENPVRFLTPRPVRPEAPLFIFLPGMDGTGQLLRTQLAGLERSFDIRCLSIPPWDLTDWGGLVQQVSDLIAAEAKEKSQRSVYLCGESFGGCLALQVLTHAPQLFERVVLVNPASSFRRLLWMRLGATLSLWTPKSFYRIGMKALVPFLSEQARMGRSDRQALWDAMNSVPAKTAAWRMSLLNSFAVERLPLERMTHPVLLITGANDRLLPSKEEGKRLVSRLPNAQMVVLPHSGHACLLETDVNLYEILHRADFIDAHAKSHSIRASRPPDDRYSK
ncbi:alpha/beta hydrolase [Romeria aff. gracilis LEGE 07310]|uniref:Alpha/beta hydrolase n=1 Tax=Vasconcelosia minhoensis LEGE 07310 TaxID=915328 RepID=A0A8J7DBH0_9CYAN|nr:alpha/beta hydrolase [Romeria gracilis]MBE9077722.1 alpha/beta hydrolase [Romeria aff. gracilis LEGE 07310]